MEHAKDPETIGQNPRSSLVHTPDWVKNAIFYQIFPDRFASSQRVKKPGNLESWDSPPTVFGFKGGDLLGVAEHLDYQQDLGISAIYFNPIFQSASSHRYHTHDYFRVDPLLGGDAAFTTMLAEAHRRGIRVVLDGVFNHASRGFFPFHHLMETGEASPYIDWFTVRGFPLTAYGDLPNYECWADLPALPKFNISNPQVREYLFDIARYWLDKGIDGWRLDVPFEIKDDSFWQEFRRLVKTANPEAYIVGEVPWEAQHWLHGDMFDAVMNYQFTQAVLGFFGGHHIDRAVEPGMMGLPSTDILDAPAFARRIERLLQIYPPEIVLAQLNLIDSHDMPRFISLVGGDQSALRLAALFQMAYPGAPCIYYGDEIGMQGGASRYPEPSRGAFPWDQSHWDIPLLEYYRGIIRMRNEHPALRTGDFIPLFAQGQVYAFLRQLGEEQLVAVFNAGDSSWQLAVPTRDLLPAEKIWQDVLGAGEAICDGGILQGMTLEPRAGVVLA